MADAHPSGGDLGGAAPRRRVDPAVAWAFGCIVLVLLVGSLYSRSFLSPEYLLQQLKVASFLGVIATGAMIVILLGQIDLSVPWVVAVGGMMSTAATGWGPLGEAMAIPVGSLFVTEPVTLGTLKFRTFNQTLVAKPEMGAVPFTGPLAIITDEGTASTAEMLAAGLQEAKRAVVVGDSSLGAVLPSVIEALPGGAVMQYVVADFKTPKGVLLEGRGVQPDKRVVETRAGLRTGRDPVLDAALVAVRASRGT